MKYRLTKADLFTTLGAWDGYCKKAVHLVACGGTAMTLLGVKESTKDVDFIIPNEVEYKYLTKLLSDIGYRNMGGAKWSKKDEGFEYDLYIGKKIYCTEL